jgi:hypothetical protein
VLHHRTRRLYNTLHRHLARTRRALLAPPPTPLFLGHRHRRRERVTPETAAFTAERAAEGRPFTITAEAGPAAKAGHVLLLQLLYVELLLPLLLL